jgi:hypothetical protein
MNPALRHSANRFLEVETDGIGGGRSVWRGGWSLRGTKRLDVELERHGHTRVWGDLSLGRWFLSRNAVTRESSNFAVGMPMSTGSARQKRRVSQRAGMSP